MATLAKNIDIPETVIERYDGVAYFKQQEGTHKEVNKYFGKMEKDNPDHNIIIHHIHLDVLGLVIHYSKIKR